MDEEREMEKEVKPVAATNRWQTRVREGKLEYRVLATGELRATAADAKRTETTAPRPDHRN